jgi:outer membrane protein assembly factor BamB
MFQPCSFLIALLTLGLAARSPGAETANRSPGSTGANWPQFRGPKSTGLGNGLNLPDQWSTNQNVAWKTVIPGSGWSSPVVWGDRVFVTAVISEGEAEAPKKGLYLGGERPTPSADTHRWVVYCVDLPTGKIAWQKEVHQGVPPGPHHLKNSYASETPVTDGERVYAYFGNVGLFCLDTAGNLVWSQKLGSYKTRNGWGTAASPVLHRDRVYVVNDNEEHSFLVALDKQTGREIWRVDRDEPSNWATPFVWENDERTELIVTGRKKVRSYDADGKVLWELSGLSSIQIPTPFAQDGLLYVSSGFVADKNRPIYAIRPGATGDISLKDGETNNTYIAWCQKTAGPYNPSPLIDGDYLYVLYDFGFLSCFEARTGREVYSKQRLNTEGASAFTASPWACDGKVYCLSEDGDTFVVQAGPVYKLLGKNSLNEMCLATPALVRGNILLRTATGLYRIQKPLP